MSSTLKCKLCNGALYAFSISPSPFTFEGNKCDRIQYCSIRDSHPNSSYTAWFDIDNILCVEWLGLFPQQFWLCYNVGPKKVSISLKGWSGANRIEMGQMEELTPELAAQWIQRLKGYSAYQ